MASAAPSRSSQAGRPAPSGAAPAPVEGNWLTTAPPETTAAAPPLPAFGLPVTIPPPVSPPGQMPVQSPPVWPGQTPVQSPVTSPKKRYS